MAKPNHARLPSHIVLALIATIPPVVAGAPLPPPAFLCPVIERDVPLPPCANCPSTSLLPNPTYHPTQCGVVADRFIQGSDSLWRKMNSWTLYGATCGSTPSTSPVQPQKTPSETSMPNVFDMSVLPAGWDNTTIIKSNTDSTIILSLAIILASLICFFMIGCVLWRRRKKKTRDVERKLGHQPSVPHDSQNNGREDNARSKTRMWAKATAHWKSNIRQSARRRRKRYCLPPSANRPPFPTVSNSPQLSLVTPSRRGSIAFEELEPSRSQEAELCRNGNVIESPVLPPRSVSPPTYGASFAPRFPRSSPSSTVPNPTPSTAVTHPVQPCSMDDEPLPYVPPGDGHVATDDKSQLAHIRQLASSPPLVIDTGTMQSISAPEWHEVEDDLQDLNDIVPTSFHDFGFPPSFPPPPSKADVPSPFRYLDDYPHRYGEGHDILVYPPVPGSPRLSLEAFPSAPPMDDPGLEPSAPSLEVEDELFQDWDGTWSSVPEVSTSADQNSTPVCAIESSIPSIVSFASRSSSPFIPESASRDGILPRYQP